jgi:hypothetical protein
VKIIESRSGCKDVSCARQGINKLNNSRIRIGFRIYLLLNFFTAINVPLKLNTEDFYLPISRRIWIRPSNPDKDEHFNMGVVRF